MRIKGHGSQQTAAGVTSGALENDARLWKETTEMLNHHATTAPTTKSGIKLSAAAETRFVWCWHTVAGESGDMGIANVLPRWCEMLFLEFGKR
jgi:hypothetical protein